MELSCFPRIRGLGALAGSGLLLNFAGLKSGPATAGGSCPAFMRTHYSWSTVSTMAEPKTRLVSLVANLRSWHAEPAGPAFGGPRYFGPGGVGGTCSASCDEHERR